MNKLQNSLPICSYCSFGVRQQKIEWEQMKTPNKNDFYIEL